MADTEQPTLQAYMCETCHVSCPSALELCDHVVGDKHRTLVGYTSPEELSQLYKLQYFLDTYLPQEPLVGLEFVEEIQMKSGYRYRCALCGFDGVRMRIFAHLTGTDHMACFLERHAPELYKRPTMFVSPARYVKALQRTSAQYCKMHGRKYIMEIKGSDDRDLDLESTPKTVPDCKLKLTNTEELQHEAYVCELCNTSCPTASDLHNHVIGNKHRSKVKHVRPEEWSQLLKLQYFLDIYIPQEPLVGLEYVKEIQMNGGYYYKCVLCGINGKCSSFFKHLTGSRHMTCFLETHVPELYKRPTKFVSRALHGKALRRAAAIYCNVHGRKNINDDKCWGPPSKFKDNGDFFDYLEKFEIRNGEDADVLKQILQNCTQALERFQEGQGPQNQPWEELPGNPQGLADEADTFPQ